VLAHNVADPRREDYARQQIAALAPRLTRLTITVASATKGLEVRRNGTPVAPASYGLSVPVDPGEYTLEASAPGSVAWSTTVQLTSPGQSLEVQVPVLESLPTPTPAVVAAPRERARPRPRPRTRALATWTAFGVGALGVGVGSYFGISAWSTWKGARQDCRDGRVCLDDAYADTVRARHYGNVSTVAFALGGAALAGGLVLYLTEPREPGPTVRLAPVAAPGTISLSLVGSF